MKPFKKMLLILFPLAIGLGCKNKGEKSTTNAIVIDTSFAGARLSKFQKTGEGYYVGHVLPENEPINSSPWFAFGLQSEKKAQIELQLKYGDHQHRYIPKLSYDKIRWTSLASDKVKIDTIGNTATLSLTVSNKKVYVAAQELESSADTYAWVDSLLKASPESKKVIAGKTALGNDNYVLLHENESVKNSIVLIARQHPPEIPGGTIGFKRFYETLFNESKLARTFRDSFNIYAFPLLNPDGADLGNWRHNANGVDLNRDWVEFSQPETQLVKTFLENKIAEGRKIRFGIDFHTSHSGPYLLVLDSINELKSDGIIPKWIKRIENDPNFKVEARRRDQDLPYCYNYFFNELGAEAVTYEDGDEIDRTTIRNKAGHYAKELMETLLGNRIER